MRRTHVLGKSILVGGVVAAGLAMSQTAFAAEYVVNTTADTVDAAPGNGVCADASGRCSLRAAIQEANASGGTDTVTLGGLTYTLTITGPNEDMAATGDLDVTSTIRILGEFSTVNANGIDRAFHVAPGGNLTVDRLTITGGVAPGPNNPQGGGSGGGILNAGTLEVNRSTLRNNTAPRAGGGIEASQGSSTVVDRSTLANNSTGPTPGNGGGLHLTNAGTVVFSRSTASGNTASAEGGGLWNAGGGTMTIDRSTITGNTASGNAPITDPGGIQGGGGLFQEAPIAGLPAGSLSVSRSEIRNNVANGAQNGSGGGVLNDRGTVRISRDTVIADNSAVRAGGGVEASTGFTRVDDSTLQGNRTGSNPGNGGGLHLSGPGRVEIDDSVVTGNSATNEGGGLWNSSTGTMLVSDTRVTGNTAPIGPNVFNQPPGGTFILNGQPVPPGQNSI